MKTKFTSDEVAKIQDKFVAMFYNENMTNNEGKKLTKEEFIKITKKHLSKEFFNN